MPAAPQAAGQSGSIAVIPSVDHRLLRTPACNPSPRPPNGSSAKSIRKDSLDPNGKVRVGLVGAGYVSAYHARALGSRPFVEMVGVADTDQSHAEALAARFHIPKVYLSLEDMEEARPDVIHILTPPGT